MYAIRSYYGDFPLVKRMCAKGGMIVKATITEAISAKVLVKASGLNDAIAAAATRAGLSEYTVRYIEKPLSTREQLLAQLSESLRNNFV